MTDGPRGYRTSIPLPCTDGCLGRLSIEVELGCTPADDEESGSSAEATWCYHCNKCGRKATRQEQDDAEVIAMVDRDAELLMA